jgi:hypothetical protein
MKNMTWFGVSLTCPHSGCRQVFSDNWVNSGSCLQQPCAVSFHRSSSWCLTSYCHRVLSPSSKIQTGLQRRLITSSSQETYTVSQMTEMVWRRDHGGDGDGMCWWYRSQWRTSSKVVSPLLWNQRSGFQSHQLPASCTWKPPKLMQPYLCT